ncbi:MAG: 30S ribosomal protein S17 [Patescibacteria group bacterium]|nr:30S ribosomal protein S17 [Patescibacteria group bacterium]
MEAADSKKKNDPKGLIEGVVASDKMDKTVVVAIDSFKAHPKYLKRYIATKKYKVHDPENKFKVGDKVKIRQSKPRSKDKRWEVI